MLDSFMLLRRPAGHIPSLRIGRRCCGWGFAVEMAPGRCALTAAERGGGQGGARSDSSQSATNGVNVDAMKSSPLSWGNALLSSKMRAPSQAPRAVSGRSRKVPDSSSLTSRAPPSAGTRYIRIHYHSPTAGVPTSRACHGTFDAAASHRGAGLLSAQDHRVVGKHSADVGPAEASGSTGVCPAAGRVACPRLPVTGSGAGIVGLHHRADPADTPARSR